MKSGYVRPLSWAFAGLFFLITVGLGRPVDGLWNSPDETANAFWAEQVVQGRPFEVRDSVIGIGRGAIHPRSMAARGDALVPGSFPGLFLLFGTLKLLIKLPFHVVTPLFTAFAGLLFGALVARLFDRRAGFWATLVFFAHPAILYYAARGLFHNVLFLDLLVFSAAFLVLRPFTTRSAQVGLVDDLLAGACFAWAVVTRASEAIWAIPAFAAFLPFVTKDRWRRLALFLAGAAVPALIFLSFNTGVYGSPFKTPYVAPVAVESGAAASGVAAVVAPGASSPSILPFGFHPRAAASHLWSYGLALFWWQTLLVAVGFVWWAIGWRNADAKQKTYAIVAAIVTLWLVVLYGSWRIMDRLDHEAVTIGTSYVRYFLPAYALALPFAGVALARLSATFGRPRLSMLVVLGVVCLTARVAVFAGDESLRSVRSTLEGNVQKKQALLRVIPPDAVVMTERFDKLLVPDRWRIIPAVDAGAFAAASAAAARGLPVFWYGLDPSAEELRRLAETAAAHALAFGVPEAPVAGEKLYPLTPR